MRARSPAARAVVTLIRSELTHDHPSRVTRFFVPFSGVTDGGVRFCIFYKVKRIFAFTLVL